MNHIEDGILAAGITYNVSDYGAVGNGVADDTDALQDAIDAAIAAKGGIIFLPQGTYRTTAPLDFSGMKGSPRGIRFEGAGRGDIFGTDLFTTRIDCDHTGSCITAYGQLAGATNLFIANLQLRNFGIKLLQNIGSNYAIDLDYVWSGFVLDKLYIWGNSKTGNGVQIRNFAHGQGRLNQVTVRQFSDAAASIGFRIAVEVTSHVDTAPNSGNTTLENCLAMNVLTGFEFGGTNLLNGMTLNALKAVRSDPITGSVGFHVDNQLKQSVFNSCHTENFETGFHLDTCEFNDFIACGTYHPDAPVDANTTGFLVDGGVCNRITGHVQKTHYGVRFINDSSGNSANVRDRTAARVLTAIYLDSSTDKTNLYVTGESNPWTWVWGVIQDTKEGAATSSVVQRYRVTGDSNFRHRVYADGKHEWNDAGDGNIRTTLKELDIGILSIEKSLATTVATITYSASMTVDCRNGMYQQITATDSTAFTITNPSHPPAAGFTMPLTIELYNNSGGALGTVTWNALYKFAGGTAPTKPANGKKRLVQFMHDGTQWLETWRSADDLL